MTLRVLANPSDAIEALFEAWSMIVDECRAVLAGEQHYQAVIYHCLRTVGVRREQLGMNVKQMIYDPVSINFKERNLRCHPLFQGGFEPIPDVVLFKAEVAGDWRRRKYAHTLTQMLMAIEIKASERDKGRLTPGEVIRDIEKLSAQREEVEHRNGTLQPVMIVIDVAPDPRERMTPSALDLARSRALAHGVYWLYVSPHAEAFDRNERPVPHLQRELAMPPPSA